MFYLIKRQGEPHQVVEAVIHDRRQWRDAWGGSIHYLYEGINQDEGTYFDSRDIIKKSKAKTKKPLLKKYAELLI